MSWVFFCNRFQSSFGSHSFLTDFLNTEHCRDIELALSVMIDWELPEILQTALCRSALAAVPLTINISSVFLTSVEAEDGHTAPFRHRAAAYLRSAVLHHWWGKIPTGLCCLEESYSCAYCNQPEPSRLPQRPGKSTRVKTHKIYFVPLEHCHFWSGTSGFIRSSVVAFGSHFELLYIWFTQF